MSPRFRVVAAIVGASFVYGTDVGATPSVTALTAIPLASVQGQSPRLTVERGGAILSWVRRTEDGHVLRAARVQASQLGSTSDVATGTDWFINPFDRPSVVALSRTSLAAHWLKRTGHTTYGYGIRMKFSDDEGKTWGPTFIPHRNRAPVQHGFAYLQPISPGSVRVAWLDGSQRLDVSKPKPESMALLSARIDKTGRISHRTVLDEQVCTCCQPALHQTTTGWLAAYRDRTSAQIRDISVAALDGKGVTGRVHLADGWRIAGCPLNGPTIASAHRRLAVSWFTAAYETPKVRIAYSSDSGATFGPPIDVATNTPIGQVSTVALSDGSFLVGWLEFGGGQLAYQVRQVTEGGNLKESHTILRSATAIASAQLACAAQRLYLSWATMSTNRVHLSHLSSELSPCAS